jgi:type IX secretion system PorP/SprF family membrane protein
MTMIKPIHLTSLILVVLVGLPFFVSGQQTFQFSQYMFNGLVINPAYAGMDDAMSITFYNRNQWAKADGAPTTQTLTAHTLFSRQHIGAGLNLINDRIGVHQNLLLSGAAAYHLKVSRQSVLSFGLQAGFGHRESDYQSLGPNAVNDPKIPSSTISHNSLDLGAGFYFKSKRLHVGLSSPQLLPAKLTVSDTVTVNMNRSQGFLFSKIILPVSAGVTIEPGFLLKYISGAPLSFDLNTNIIFQKVLITGVSYRRDESVDFLLRAQITPQLQVGYGYDYLIGNASGLSNASHELMVNYLFKFTRSNISSPR